MKLKIRIGMHTLPRGSQLAGAAGSSGSPPGARWWPGGPGGGWEGEPGGRGLCLQVADPLCCTAETDSILNQLHSNKKEEKSLAPFFSWHETLALVFIMIRVNKISLCEKQQRKSLWSALRNWSAFVKTKVTLLSHVAESYLNVEDRNGMEDLQITKGAKWRLQTTWVLRM